MTDRVTKLSRLALLLALATVIHTAEAFLPITVVWFRFGFANIIGLATLYLFGFKDRMAHAKSLLTDEALTAFFFVTLPESLPIAVITRFINWFHEFGIPVGGVVVNGLIQKEQVGKDAVEFVQNRIKMQEEHMEEIWRIFGDKVRAILPLFETEVKGAKMLNRTLEHLFAS